MAIKIVREGVAMPGAFGVVIADKNHTSRYKQGDMVEVIATQPTIGDEILCESDDGEIAIGELVEVAGNRLVLVDSCHVTQGPNITVNAANCWKIVGCHLGYAQRLRRSDMSIKTEKSIRHAARRAVKEKLRYVGIQRYKLLYLRSGKEVSGPWFYNKTRARKAREIMEIKYGPNSAILYID